MNYINMDYKESILVWITMTEYISKKLHECLKGVDLFTCLFFTCQ